MSILDSLRYVSRSRRGKAPQFFKETLVSVTGIYLLTHAVGLLDLWLHSSARALSVTRSVPVEVDAPYGYTYNEAKCGPFEKTELPCPKMVGARWGRLEWAGDDTFMKLQVANSIAGVNPYTSLEFVNGTAIIVPGPSKKFASYGFTFSTYGVHVHCTNLRDQCDRLVTSVAQFLVPEGSPVINCSNAGYPQIPYYTSGELKPTGFDMRNIRSFVFGINGDEMGGMVYVTQALYSSELIILFYYSNGTGDFTSGWTSNPALMVVQLRWSNVTARDTTGTPGVAYLNALDLYAACHLTYLDVVAHYEPLGAEWSIVETNLTSPELASVFWSPLLFRLGANELLYSLSFYMKQRLESHRDPRDDTRKNQSGAYCRSDHIRPGV